MISYQPSYGTNLSLFSNTLLSINFETSLSLFMKVVKLKKIRCMMSQYRFRLSLGISVRGGDFGVTLESLWGLRFRGVLGLYAR